MIKLFEDFNEIHDICKKYEIENYTINADGSIDVEGNVDISELELFSIPLKFNRVLGNFMCQKNLLTSLEGAPNYVSGNFFCYLCNLTSLKGAPTYVGGEFDCDHNKLITLEFCPKEVGGSVFCNDNLLVTLDFFPQHIANMFSTTNNKLTTLSKSLKNVNDFIYIAGNPLPKIIIAYLRDIKFIIDNMDDYGIWNKDGSFNEIRFKMMMDEKES